MKVMFENKSLIYEQGFMFQRREKSTKDRKLMFPDKGKKSTKDWKLMFPDKGKPDS